MDGGIGGEEVGPVGEGVCGCEGAGGEHDGGVVDEAFLRGVDVDHFGEDGDGVGGEAGGEEASSFFGLELDDVGEGGVLEVAEDGWVG